MNRINKVGSLPSHVKLETGPGGLERISVQTPEAQALVYLQGAHLASWRPRDQKHDVLWMSRHSRFEPGQPIRGGVPICFPWFGARREDASSPAHGFARRRLWQLEEVQIPQPESVLLELSLSDDEETRSLWPAAFELRYRLLIGPELLMTLTVKNRDDQPFVFEEALHTYFTVGDVRRVRVYGLQGAEYLDKTDHMVRKRQEESVVRVDKETDRLYVNTTASCLLEDETLGRRITIDKQGSSSTVVWNPWIDKARALEDFGDDEWSGMICIETANAADNAVALGPGQSHSMQVTLRVTPYHP